MSLNDIILSKKGPLARVWLAAHLERKLTKSALLQASIPKSVQAIVNVEFVPIALRLSGQLLLGVARIYSRKAKYLMDDCTETLSRVKMAFKPAAVDMPAEQEHVATGSINRPQENITEFDLLYGQFGGFQWHTNLDFNGPLELPSSQHRTKKSNVAENAEITLPEQDYDDMIDNIPDYDFMGPGLDSQHYTGGESFNLDLDFGDALEPTVRTPSKKRKSDHADLSIELGRDAVNSSARRQSSVLGGLNGDLNLDHGMDGQDLTRMSDPYNVDFEAEADNNFNLAANDSLDASGMDLDLGLNFDEPLQGGITGMLTPPLREPTPRLANSEREASATAQTEKEREKTPELTPRTSKRITAAADRLDKDGPAHPRKKRKKAPTKQIVDAFTELETHSPRRAGNNNTMESSLATRSGKEGYEERVRLGLISPPKFLPASRIHLQLLEMNANPALYYLPRLDETKEFYNAAPLDFAPELQALFRLPVKHSRRTQRETQQTPKSALKKRSATIGDAEVELGRRASQALEKSDGLDLNLDGFEGFGDQSADFSGGGFQFDIEDDIQVPLNDIENSRREREVSVFSAYSNRGGEFSQTPATVRSAFLEEDTMAKGEGALAIFDDLRLRGHPSLSQSNSPSKSSLSAHTTPEKSQIKSWSRSTLAAARIIQDQVGANQVDEDFNRELSFNESAQRASKRAAASFFFELLVLGSRDCIKIKQTEAHGDIKVAAKPRLFEVVDVNVLSTAGPLSRGASPETPLKGM